MFSSETCNAALRMLGSGMKFSGVNFYQEKVFFLLPLIINILVTLAIATCIGWIVERMVQQTFLRRRQRQLG